MSIRITGCRLHCAGVSLCSVQAVSPASYFPYANHGAGIFTYITGWFCSGKCWDSYSSTMEHLGYWSLWTIVNHGSSIYYWRIGFGGLGKLEGSCLDVELSAQMSSSHDGLSPTWHPDNEHDECCFQPSNLVVLAYVDKPMLDIFGFIYIYISGQIITIH